MPPGREEVRLWTSKRTSWWSAAPPPRARPALGAALALAHGGEVVSADSMQIYRGMDIGTAKPTAEEMTGVPHHMLDIAVPGEDYSVAGTSRRPPPRWRTSCPGAASPIVVGGTGLYIDNLVAGREFAPFSGLWRRRLQDRAREEGIEALYAQLRSVDPERAARLHRHDEKRILRALEVWYETGETITDHDRRTRNLPPRYHALRLGLDFLRREDLWARIDRRVDQMMAQGLAEEVRALLEAGVPPLLHRHAGHWLQGARRRPPGGGPPGGRRRGGEAPLPPVRQAAAHLVPAHPGGPVAVLGGVPRF